MGDKDLGSASVGSETLENFSVPQKSTDGPTGLKETSYINNDWPQQWGYYKTTPKLKTDIEIKCSWIVGKGWIADEATTIILDRIKGFGKDTFNSIMQNAERVKHVGGDSFAEIITDDKDILINLKPLDPGTVKTIVNRAGIIIRYELIDKASKSLVKRIISKITRKKYYLRLPPEKMFHLCRNRGADEIHGESIVPAVEPMILAIEEAMADWKIVLHRNVYPQIIWHLDTDNPAKIAEFKAKREAANKDRENIYIPKGAVEREVAGVPPNSTLNPLAWIDQQTQHFHQATGVPDVVGGGGSVSLTDASSKIKYLGFEQTIRGEQLELEEQILSQLNLVVTFPMPAMLENDMMSGKPNEEGAGSVAIPQEEPVQGPEPNDTQTGMVGRT